MLPTPKKFTLLAGAAEGGTKLNAFDNALLAAGIGNLNLLKVSSILPPEAEYVEELNISPGALTPTAYGTVAGEQPGELISAAVGVGFSPGSFGVIMEYSGHCEKAEAEEKIRLMLENAFHQRNIRLEKVMVKGIEWKVKQIGAVFAGVALWY